MNTIFHSSEELGFILPATQITHTEIEINIINYFFRIASNSMLLFIESISTIDTLVAKGFVAQMSCIEQLPGQVGCEN